MNSASPCLASSSKTKQVVHHNHTVVTISNESVVLREEMFNDIPVCITKVPDSLTSANPESYSPTKFGLGPHHHGRPALQEAEIHKASEAVKYFDQHFRVERTFSGLVEEIQSLSPKIRACYSSRLKMEDSALARIMATDGLFLCKRLRECDEAASDKASQIDNDDDEFFFRDVIMLENQLPILVLKKILDVQFFSSDDQRDVVTCHLQKILWSCCRVLYPFDRALQTPLWPANRISNHGHLLGLLYSLILAADKEEEEEDIKKNNSKKFRNSRSFMELFDSFVNTMLPNSASTVPKTKIPRASRLVRLGVKFVAVEGIRAIKFNPGTASLHLPAIKLGPNSDVAIRNLVAYEQFLIESRQLKHNPDPIFTTYVELMEGLAWAEEDVEVLRDQRIVVSEESTFGDQAVARLFKTRVGAYEKRSKSIDKAIIEVSEYCDGFWKAGSRKLCKKLVHILWSLCRLVFFFSLSGMFCVSIFCSVFQCGRNHSQNNNSHRQQARQMGFDYLTEFSAYT